MHLVRNWQDVFVTIIKYTQQVAIDPQMQHQRSSVRNDLASYMQQTPAYRSDRMPYPAGGTAQAFNADKQIVGYDTESEEHRIRFACSARHDHS